MVKFQLEFTQIDGQFSAGNNILTPRSWAEALLQIRRWACAKLDGVAANDPRW